MQIAIDTSTDIASLALVQGSDVLAELTWRCGQNHTVELYPRLDFLIAKSGLDIKSADCIFVAKGPGSFNGLRVGVSAAKGLAFSLNIPIIGISTLESTAYQHCIDRIAGLRYSERRPGRDSYSYISAKKEKRLAPDCGGTYNYA